MLTVGVLVATLGGVASAAPSPIRGPQPRGRARGGPGAQSYLDVARKDCFGTARNTTSKVWFTVADGVLSDVFSPTLENTNVNTLQYIVTDGRTFADLQQRNMTYTVSSPDSSGMVCDVTSVDRRHRFEITTEYITDPSRASVVMATELRPLGRLRPSLRNLRLYVRFDATIDNTGGGGAINQNPNNAVVEWPSTALVSSDSGHPRGAFAARVVAALVANRPFVAESSGFVGTASDGLRQLDRYHRLAHDYDTAFNGNVVQTAEIDAGVGTPFVLALGFGRTARGAVTVATRSASQSFTAMRRRYEHGWHAYDHGLVAPPARLSGYTRAENVRMRRSYWLSANVLKAAEDKTYPGAFVASPTDPWGQSVPATTVHPGWTYREVFARDSYETFTALLADGDRHSARQMVKFLFDHAQLPDGTFPRDSELNGLMAPDTYKLEELDENAYPLLMAYQAGFAGDRSLYVNHIRPDADFLLDHGPAYGVDRWEQQGGFSPSTIAAEVAGLVAASQLASAAGDSSRSQLYLATADSFQRRVKNWTVTTNGPYVPHRYFIRLSVNGNPDSAATYDLGNGSFTDVDQRRVLDPGFLELTRLGELPATDPDVQSSLTLVDYLLENPTPTGSGWHRYGSGAGGSTDGYGDCYGPGPTDCRVTGAPWFPKSIGTGHLWPILSGERAEEDLQLGESDAAAALALSMRRGSWGLGYIPQQVWEDPTFPPSRYGSNPKAASIGFIQGKAAGSAAPLIWAQAQYLRLLRDIATGSLLDQPSITAQRYLASGPPTTMPLRVDSLQPGTTGSAGTTTISGTTAPGARVALSASQTGSASNTTTVTATTADSQGNFTATVPTPKGRILFTITAVVGSHASAWLQGAVQRS